MAVLGAQTAHASVIQLQPNNIGLVGYWSFNEGTSTIAHDFSGNGNTGTLSGSTLPAWTSGKLGYGLTFNNSPSYVSVADASSLEPAAITVAAWVNPSSLPDWATVAMKTTSDSWNDGFGLAHYQGGNGINFFINNYSTNEASGTLSLNTWSYVVGTYDGSNIKLYINGVLVSSAAYSTLINNSSNVLRIGSGTNNTGAAYPWIGALDEVRIYNRALTATEVAGLYQSGLAKINVSQSPGTLANGLVGWWTMDGADTVWSSATAGSEMDRSGNGNTGTLTNMNRSTSPVLGKIGQALQFDGSSSYIATNRQSTNFISASTGSISVWVKPMGSSPSVSNAYNGLAVVSDADGIPHGTCWGDYGIFRANISSTDAIWAENYDGSEEKIAIPYANNAWVHIVWVHSGGVLYAYKNGTLVSSVAAGNSLLSTCYLFIGTAGTSQYFNGSIDDVRIYNRALSASEVQQLYNLGAGTHVNTSSANLQQSSSLANGLVGYWTFDGPTISGTTVKDLSGQGNNGTNNGAMPTIGKLGQALQFNGSSNYINLGTGSQYNFPDTTFTVSAWIRTSANSVWQVFAANNYAAGGGMECFNI
jgi:hypothetical protein